MAARASLLHGRSAGSSAASEHHDPRHGGDRRWGAGYRSGTYDGLVQPLPRDLFDEICPSALSPIRMGDKWAPLVLRCLEDGPRRFSELRVPMHRTSAKELTRSLRNLERDGMVQRTAAGRS